MIASGSKQRLRRWVRSGVCGGARGVRDALLSPMMLGAAYVSFLAVWVGRADRAPGEEIGAHAQELRTFIEGHFGHELRQFAVAILAFSLAVGALLGLVAGYLVAWRDRRRRRGTRGPYGRALETLALVVFLHAGWVAWGMARSPGLYAQSFYAQGGAHRLAQVLVSDGLGRAGVLLVWGLVVGLYVVGPRAPRRAWRERLRGSRNASVVALVVAFCGAVLIISVALGARHLLAGASRSSSGGTSSGGSSGFSGFSTQPAPRAGAPKSGAGEDGHMNILILAADSLRADRFVPRTMPHMSAFASQGTVFDKAYVSLPRTFPSWVTWLTGRHPHHHGIVTMFPRWEDRAKDFDALPESLARTGYRTTVVSDFVGDIFPRIDLGFSNVDAPPFDFIELLRGRLLERETPLLPFLDTGIGRSLFPVMRELEGAADPELLVDHAIAALDRGDPSAPFFMTIFSGSAHFPYAARAPYHRRFSEPAYRGRYKYKKAMSLESDLAPNADDVPQIRALYDGAVASIDDAFERMLQELVKRHLEDRTIVVLLADHGEALFEPGRGGAHGDHLFGDDMTHVPLLIFDPRIRKGLHQPRVVRDVDLAPTLYELAGVAPPHDLDGRSLASALSGSDLPPALAYSETEIWFTEEIPTLSPQGLRLPYPGIELITEVDEAHHREIVVQKRMLPIIVAAKHRMVRDERFKLVYVPTRMGAKYMLYDTEADPREEHDVAAEHPAEVARLGAELRAYILRDPSLMMRNGMAVPRDDFAAFHADASP